MLLSFDSIIMHLVTRKQKHTKHTSTRLGRFVRSVWFLPVCLLVVLAIFTGFKISGSSVGAYHNIFYGGETKDPNLLYGHPRPIRSDEWLYMTQMTIAQKEAGYPKINPNVNTGRDMSLITDVPYKEWSVVFKPQNLAFFVLPFEYAFAFKWWLLLYLLIISCYFFILKLLPGKRLYAALLSVGFGCSPFVFWWYQTVTIAPLYYGFFILIVFMRILRQEPIRFLKTKWATNVAHALVLAYLLVSFALVLYPPFQIPVAVVGAFYAVGYLLNEWQDKTSLKTLLPRLYWIGAALLITAIVGLIFVKTRSEPINRINHTVYPGSRVISSGSLEPLRIFDSFVMPVLQSKGRAAYFFANQSEASNFILLLPYLVVPGFLVVWLDYRKRKHIDWLLLSMQICGLLFLARVLLHFGDPLYKLLLLHKVPNERLVIGFGFVGILQLVLLFRSLLKLEVSRKAWQLFATGYGTITLAIVLFISHTIDHNYPGFLRGNYIWIILPCLFAALIYTFLLRKWLAFTLLFCALSVASVFRVNPLYRGLGVLGNNMVEKKISALSNEHDRWGVADDLVFENFPLLADRQSVTGIQIYPDVAFWRKVEGAAGDSIYNRYAHSVFNSNQSSADLIRLSQEDTFQVKLACGTFLQREVDYILTPIPVNVECLHEAAKITYPKVTLLLYKVDDPR